MREKNKIHYFLNICSRSMLCIKYIRIPLISTISCRSYAVTKTATGPSGAALKLGGGVASKKMIFFQINVLSYIYF